MQDVMVSGRHAGRFGARGERRTERKWRRSETVVFAAVVSGGAWALILGVAAIVL